MTFLASLYRKLPIDQIVTSNIYLYRFVRSLVKQHDIFLPHEPDFEAFRLFVPSCGIFLDVGANDGLSARSFRKFDRTTPIVAIEPNPCHQDALKRCKQRLPAFDYLLIGASESETTMTLFTPIYKGYAMTSYTSFHPEEARRNLATYLRIRDIAKFSTVHF
jgi:FkbM family methyltransferase